MSSGSRRKSVGILRMRPRYLRSGRRVAALSTPSRTLPGVTDRDLAAALVVLRDVLHHAEAGDPDARRCAIAAADAARGVVPALTVEQVAAALGVAVVTVRREINRGELGAIHRYRSSSTGAAPGGIRCLA